MVTFTMAVAISAGGACAAQAFPRRPSRAGEALVEQAKPPDAFGEFPARWPCRGGCRKKMRRCPNRGLTLYVIVGNGLRRRHGHIQE
jgi:hypothetical protein